MTVSENGCLEIKKKEKTLELINCLCYNAIQSENKKALNVISSAL